MSNLTKEQIIELERLWNNSDNITSTLVSADDLARIGQRFKPSLEKMGYHKPGMREAIEKAAEQRVMSFAEKIREIVCLQWGYCGRRDAFRGEGFQLCLAVADALLGAVTHIPVPMTVLSVYLVRRGLLDKICRCPQ